MTLAALRITSVDTTLQLLADACAAIGLRCKECDPEAEYGALADWTEEEATFAEEDWTKTPGPRSQRRWVHNKTGRVVYSDTNPGASKRGKGGKKAVTAQPAAAPEQPAEAAPAEDRPVTTPAVREAVDLLRGLTPETLTDARVRELATMLGGTGGRTGMSVKELNALKTELGITASGAKTKMAAQIIEGARKQAVARAAEETEKEAEQTTPTDDGENIDLDSPENKARAADPAEDEPDISLATDDEDESIDLGSGEPQKSPRDVIAAALASADLPDDQKKAYGEAMTNVMGRMPAKAQEMLQKGLRDVAFHADTKSIGRATMDGVDTSYFRPEALAAWEEKKRQIEAGEVEIGGFYRPATGELHVDGDTSGGLSGQHGTDLLVTEGVHAHEMTHAIDSGGGLLSADGAWQSAWKSEMGAGADLEHKLTGYAAANVEEGFAEFGRLLYGTDTPLGKIKADFPKASAFFEKQGLWPDADARPSGGTAPLAEVFGERIDTGNGSHADTLLAKEAEGKKPPDADALPARATAFVRGEGATRATLSALLDEVGDMGKDDAIALAKEVAAASDQPLTKADTKTGAGARRYLYRALGKVADQHEPKPNKERVREEADEDAAMRDALGTDTAADRAKLDAGKKGDAAKPKKETGGG